MCLRVCVCGCLCSHDALVCFRLPFLFVGGDDGEAVAPDALVLVLFLTRLSLSEPLGFVASAAMLL